jgi:hypothetical protein
MALTDMKIQAIKPSTKPQKCADGGGLLPHQMIQHLDTNEWVAQLRGK